MSGLNQKLTQLRQQIGDIESRTNFSKSEILKSRLRNQLRDSRLDIRYQVNSEKLTDEQLAEKLSGTVLSDGLIYIQSQQVLDNIHETYDASGLITNFDTWPEQTSEHLEDLLFIDTETTGLSGGSGILVFLLGVAEIVGHTIVNHQLLLNGFVGERAMLSWFNNKLKGNKTLVSYNGKSFDAPLLANRFRLHKMRSPLLALPHIDLLHWIRRLYQKQWPDCRLPSAEQACLAFHRQDDVSGAEAPAIWGELIRRGATDQMQLLLRHHYWDVLSLVGLLDVVNKRIKPVKQNKINYYAVANYFLRAGKLIQAKSFLEANRQGLCDKGFLLLANIYRKLDDGMEALEIWECLARKNHEFAMEKLAKHHEHVSKKVDVALSYTHRLLQVSMSPKHLKRQQRLTKKLKKVNC